MIQIETVAMPTRASRVEVAYVPMPGVSKPKTKQTKAKPPKDSKTLTTIKAAAEAYKSAYKAVYGMNPRLTYDGTWIRLAGAAQGVSLARLKEMTTQLRNRKG